MFSIKFYLTLLAFFIKELSKLSFQMQMVFEIEIISQVSRIYKVTFPNFQCSKQRVTLYMHAKHYQILVSRCYYGLIYFCGYYFFLLSITCIFVDNMILWFCHRFQIFLQKIHWTFKFVFPLYPQKPPKMLPNV